MVPGADCQPIWLKAACWVKLILFRTLRITGKEEATNERSHSSRLPSGARALRLRRRMGDPFDQARQRGAPGNLLQLPSILYGQAEADRHGRPCRKVPA